PNLAVRMLAANQLVERGGEAVIAAVRANMQLSSHTWQRCHGLWVLERLHALDDAALEEAARDSDRAVRVHAMHILAERKDLSSGLHQVILDGLKDKDPFVERAAADALSTHPAPENIGLLLELRHKIPAEDTLLVHTVRMALRNQ